MGRFIGWKLNFYAKQMSVDCVDKRKAKIFNWKMYKCKSQSQKKIFFKYIFAYMYLKQPVVMEKKNKKFKIIIAY